MLLLASSDLRTGWHNSRPDSGLRVSHGHGPVPEPLTCQMLRRFPWPCSMPLVVLVALAAAKGPHGFRSSLSLPTKGTPRNFRQPVRRQNQLPACRLYARARRPLPLPLGRHAKAHHHHPTNTPRSAHWNDHIDHHDTLPHTSSRAEHDTKPAGAASPWRSG